MTHVRPALVLAVLAFALDQATKEVVLAFQDSLPVVVLPFFNLVLVWNPGVSFGMFGGDKALEPWILVGLALAISIGLLIWLARERDRVTALAIGLVLGGAIGNVVDRLRHGAVVDFLDFHVSGYHWPAFNVADAAIVVGALLLVAESFMVRKKEAAS
jgi:signal peptidase II